MSARLPMKTHDEARRSLSRLIRLYHDDGLEEGKFRALVYGFNALLSYFKLAADLRIEERLDKIEAKLEEQR